MRLEFDRAQANHWRAANGRTSPSMRCLKKPYPSRRDVLVGLVAEIFMAAHELRFVKAHASHMGDAEGLSAT